MKKLLFCILLAIPIYAQALTKTEIIEQERLLLRDNDASNRRWTDAQLTTRNDMAEIEFVKRTRCVKDTSLIAITTTTTSYTLPADWLSTDRVCYAILPLTTTTTTYKLLEYWTLDGMDTKQPGWENTSQGYPSRYMYRDDTVVIWPPASASYAGSNYLKIEYTARPSTSTTIPYNEKVNLYGYHNAIIWYTLSFCYSDTGAKELELYYWQKFLGEVDAANDDMNNRPDKKAGFAPK
jgi:hypothetical protein